MQQYVFLVNIKSVLSSNDKGLITIIYSNIKNVMTDHYFSYKLKKPLSLKIKSDSSFFVLFIDCDLKWCEIGTELTAISDVFE